MKNYQKVEQVKVEICDALNEAGFKLNNQDFDPELFPSMKEFLELYLIYDKTIYEFLISEGLLHRDFCLLCGETLNSANTSQYSFFDRKYYMCNDCYDKTVPQHKKKKDGCYIATACYGSYSHPDVLVLRRFRDNTLSKNIFGRYIIAFYYLVSPKIAGWLVNKKTANKLVKDILLQPLIKRLK